MMTKLQQVREAKGLTQSDLAHRSAVSGHAGNAGHMLVTIKTIETGVLYSPLPRKTYEWWVLADALGCSVDDIWEER